MAVPPAQAFAPIQAIGGETGWYKGALLWRLRGLLDVLVGGPGLRRGRRDPVGLEVGDTLDFWRVEAFEPDRLLRLSAEMKVPGRAWLQFEVVPDAAGSGSIVSQTAIFDPSGLFGLVYWYSLWPFHGYIFGGMLKSSPRLPTRGTRADTETAQTRHTFRSSLFCMEEARRVIERLERIEALDRATASPAELLAELRGLLHDAEAWVRVEGGDAADEAVIRLREALARDAVPA